MKWTEMRVISMIVLAALLFTGCGSYYKKINTGSAVDPSPRTYFDPGDDVVLELNSGRRVAGTIERIRSDSITIDGEVIPWNEVVDIGKRRYRVAATAALIAVAAGFVVLVVGIATLDLSGLD